MGGIASLTSKTSADVIKVGTVDINGQNVNGAKAIKALRGLRNSVQNNPDRYQDSLDHGTLQKIAESRIKPVARNGREHKSQLLTEKVAQEYNELDAEIAKAKLGASKPWPTEGDTWKAQYQLELAEEKMQKFLHNVSVPKSEQKLSLQVIKQKGLPTRYIPELSTKSTSQGIGLDIQV